MLHRNPVQESFDFTPLTSERRSPFYGVDPKLMYPFFAEMEALEEEMAKRSDEEEGCVLFRQSREQEKVHILVTGGIVFFLDNSVYPREVGDEVAVGEAGDEQIRTLQDSNCCGIIRPGQIAGMHELLLSHILPREEDNIGCSDDLEASRRKALIASSLPAVAGFWLHSGFLATHSKVISVKAERFRTALLTGAIEKRLSSKDPKEGDVNFTTEKFIRRCEEETMFFNARYLHDKALAKEGRHDIRLAHIWYEYYLRTPTQIRKRFNNSKKGYMCQVKVEQLAWLLGVGTKEVKRASDQLIKIGVLQRTTSTGKPLAGNSTNGPREEGGNTKAQHAKSSCFNFDPRAVRDYYKLRGDAEALAQKYSAGYCLKPLAEGEVI